MLVSFTVGNFRSFLQEETLSLVASRRIDGSHQEHTVPIPDSTESVLRAAVIYGANGAGKSNLFKALLFLRAFALRSQEKNEGTAREPFRFAGTNADPSTFDLQFITNEKLYRFGVSLDDKRVLEEWLIRIEGGRERPLYLRKTDDRGQVTIEIEGLTSVGDKLRALATVGGPQNQSFLATVNVTLDSADIGEELSGVLVWFKRGLDLIAPNASFRSLGKLLDADSGFNRFAGEFLKEASTGVDHLDVLKTEISEDELRSLLPESVLGKALQDIDEDKDGRAFIPLGKNSEVLVERKGEKRFYRIGIQSIHEHESGKPIPLELAEESDGTKRLLNLMPALHNLRKSNIVYFIDEIDRSLHPILVWRFLEFFLKSCVKGPKQIIVTTHESNLLDLELLRRDEIWFAEKDQQAATRLYSLSDFKVRKDLEIRKHYLQGRFGGVPFLGNLENLMVKDRAAE